MAACVEEFSVIHDESLPSDHAPVSVKVSLAGVDVEGLLDRVHNLGERVVSHGTSITQRACVKPIKKVDESLFLQKLENFTVPVLGENVDEAVKQVTNVLYQKAKTSGREARARERNSNLDRWECLLL